ncbi:hypothetical protein CPB84DRAFT_1783018 [Gymnopilus junonius]|uniref:Uncharacterized protein n=1 Tax=Gymnopilus junonius TaxID=109634 RepID=A0A9P5NLQ8_GYMJU|nr:hypothetical protein CPB84DRAFT_1783018 [Gymnopilus junonius]
MESYGREQYPQAQWAGSFQQNPPASPYSPMAPEYDGGYARDNPGAYAGSSSHHRNGYFPQQTMPHVSGMTPSDQGFMDPMAMHGYEQGSFPPTNHGHGQGFQHDIPPLEEYYDTQPPRPPSRGRSLRMTSPSRLPLVPSRPYPQQPQMRYSPPPIIPLPESSYAYDHRTRSRSRRRRQSYDSYGTYPSQSYRRSYSDEHDSYSPRRSRRSSHYTTSKYPRHRSSRTSTTVHQSSRYPTVVPINGGYGGYVVVPAKGQRLRVTDGRPRSFISRIFSPSTWGFGNRYSSHSRY